MRKFSAIRRVERNSTRARRWISKSREEGGLGIRGSGLRGVVTGMENSWVGNSECRIQNSELGLTSPGVYEGVWTSLVLFSQAKKRFFEIVGGRITADGAEERRGGTEGSEESKEAMNRRKRREQRRKGG